MTQRLKKVYQEYTLRMSRGATHSGINIHEVPRIKKIVINRGLGAQTSKMVEASLSELSIISAQTGTVTYSRRSVAGFKIREKVPIGVKATLRGERIYAFFDRLVNLRLPRIRDFQGLSSKSFDKDGNYNIGLEEQLIFPEISYEQIDQLLGIDISIRITYGKSSKTMQLMHGKHYPFNRREKGTFLLKQIGIPFNKSAGTSF
jgi:large subunit ribosomal protein L5